MLKGIPLAHQRLIFDGSQMQNNKTLEDYNLIEDSGVHLVVQRR